MWGVFLLLQLLIPITPALAESGFSENYERDYYILNPGSRYAPDQKMGTSYFSGSF